MAKISDGGDVNYTIAAHDVTDKAVQSAVAGMERLRNTSDRMAAQMKAHWESLRKHWLGVTAAIYGSYKTLQTGWNLMDQSAQFEQSKMAFRTMAASMGQDADMLYRKLKETSAGLIDEKTLVEATNRAASLGIPLEKIGDLMEIARAKARDMGTQTAKAFSDIVTGIGRASPLILDNLGITIKIGDANERMARSLNKTAAALTEDEKKMAVLNATIEAGREALGRYDMAVLTNYERMQQLRATWEDTKLLLGTGVTRMALAAAGAFQWLSSGVLTVVSGFMKLMEIAKRSNAFFTLDAGKKASILAEAEAYRVAYEAAQNGAVTLAGEASEKIKAAFASVNDLTAATAKNLGGTSTRTMAADAAHGGGADEKAKALAEELEMRQQFFSDLNESYNMVNLGYAEKAAEELRMKQEQLQTEYDMRLQFFEDVNEATRISNQLKEENDRESLEKRLEMERKHAEAKKQLASTSFGALAGIAAAFYDMSGKQSKAAFELYKMMSIAETIVSTYKAAQDAYAWGMKYGGPYAPALATAAAAAAVAAGISRVMQIQSMQMSTQTTATTSGGYSYSPSLTGTVEKEKPISEQERPLSVTIHVHGNVYDPTELARELSPYIEKARKDGVH